MKGKIKVPANQLDPDCNSAAFFTIHLNNCAAWCGTQVEIGLKHYSPNEIVIWTEQQQNGPIIHNDNITTGAFNTFITLRLKVSQAGDVFFEYNFGNGWTTTWSSPYSTTWGSGYPMGESEKKGSATQMHSNHRNLQYLTSNWNQTDWPSMMCIIDEAPGWSWSPLAGSSNDYDVVNVGGDTCAAA